jgi:2-dehydro-3-deoxyglucarate aldolase/4-hydroxy-2-oxoheptanedioate aldolase
MRENAVKRTLAGAGVALGTMVFEFDSTGIARAAAAAGAEFVIFDMEHSGWSTDTIRTLVATARGAELVPMVRVPATQYHLIARPLDVGAMGIMVPNVETEEQARTIVNAARYPPVGARGAGFGLAHDDYRAGDAVAEMRRANAEVLLIAQIESVRGVENVEQIAALEGIDVLWVGHFDLTNSMGIPTQFTHPEYLRAVERVIAACARHGKAAGFMVSDVETAKRALVQGFRILAYWGDVWIYQEGLRRGLDGIRTHLAAGDA